MDGGILMLIAYLLKQHKVRRTGVVQLLPHLRLGSHVGLLLVVFLSWKRWKAF